MSSWAAASETGGSIPFVVSYAEGAGKKSMPVELVFSRPRTGVKLEDERADFEISGGAVVCRVMKGLTDIYWPRIRSVFPVLAALSRLHGQDGFFALSLGDEGLQSRVLAFSSNVPDYLIPDPSFVHSRGYLRQRESYALAAPWQERRDMLYWRGTDTGVWRYRQVDQAPRVGICRLAKNGALGISAAITNVEKRKDSGVRARHYAEHGLLGAWEHQDEILKYRYQLDIDGNASAWSGFFLKLLSGSPVLKIASEFHWRQWYYADLVPGQHYVPVDADLSNLEEKLNWLRANPLEAQRIGESGRQFALSRTFPAEIGRAADTVRRLMTFNGRTREVVEQTGD